MDALAFEEIQKQGCPNVIRERLGAAVKDNLFDRGTMMVAALSPQHHRMVTQRTAGPIRELWKR